MKILFLEDYSVGTPPEVFTKGDIVDDRSPASELHFVRRGKAAYLGDDGVLTNQEGAVIGHIDDLTADQDDGREVVIPEAWLDLPWFTLRALAKKISGATIPDKVTAVKVVEDELVRRSEA